MFRFVAALCGLGVLAGCSVPEVTAQDAYPLTELQLCQSYARAKLTNNANVLGVAKTELIRRKAVSNQDLEDMAQGVIREGMKEHVAICSWGPYRDVNTTVVAGSRSKQFVISLSKYVYTRDGRVYAWQH